MPENDFDSIGRLITNNGEMHLKIATFNCNGARGGKTSIKNIARVTNVLALQKTMHSTKEKLMDAIRMEDKLVFQIPAKRCKNSGRFSGGMAFIIDKCINALPFFPHENISYLLVNQYAIINIYMPYYKNINSENYTRYVEDIAKLENVIAKVQQQNKQVILLGDMNADFISMNQHAKELSELFLKFSMFPQDIKEKQIVNYSYNKKYRNNVTKSWPDHICISRYSKLIKVIECKIKNTLSIDSDHLPIILNAKLQLSNKHMLAEAKVEEKHQIDWLDPVAQKRYSVMVCNTMKDIINVHLLNYDYANIVNDPQLSLEMSVILNDISHKLNSVKISLAKQIKEEIEREKIRNKQYYKKSNYW